MKILHTSDWHLGNTWNGRSRQREFETFLDWLAGILETEKVDVLVHAGDVFDTSTPGHAVQGLYFNFLERAARTCRMIVVVAGNHDSPQLLDAPKAFLKRSRVHVVGVCGEPESELAVLEDEKGTPELIVAAVPFLRDRDVRLTEAGESFEEKERKAIEGIREHYAAVVDAAEQIRNGSDIPLMATGHLFVAGGTTSESERDLRVGKLGRLGVDVFPEAIDYLALGHLHTPQKIESQKTGPQKVGPQTDGKAETRRYSGSPLPMNIDEAGREHSVLLVEFEGRKPVVRSVAVPEFSNLVRIKGTLEEIRTELESLLQKAENTDRESDWEYLVDILYTGEQFVPDLMQEVNGMLPAREKNILILRIRYEHPLEAIRLTAAPEESLEKLDPALVFQRLLDDFKEKNRSKKSKDALPIDENLEAELVAAYREILRELA